MDMLQAGAKPNSRKRMTQAERTALSDKRMFEAALSLISEHGIGNTTLKEIGERAGYSRGLASSRFGSKEQFLYELVGSIHDKWRTDARPVVETRRGIDALNAGVDLMVEFLLQDSEYVRSMYLLYYETIGSNALIRKRLARRHSAYRKTLSRWLREAVEDKTARPDIDPERLASEFLAFYFGMIYLWLAEPSSVDFRQEFSGYRDSLMARVVMRMDCPR